MGIRMDAVFRLTDSMKPYHHMFRPRFSFRTLAIFITLVCCYSGAWEATKEYGVAKIDGYVMDEFRSLPPADWYSRSSCYSVHSPAPCVVARDGTKYYLWLFG